MRWAVVACLLLAACDRVFLGDQNFRDAPPGNCLRDGFDPPLSNNWDALPTTGAMPMIEGGVLKIPHDTTRVVRVEVASNRPFDFTGGDARVMNLESLPITNGFATTYFALGVDSDNAYVMAVFADNPERKMSFLQREKGIDTNVLVPFNPMTFKHWRFVHVPETDTIEYYTSETGEDDNWAKRFEQKVKVPITQIKFSIGTTSPGFGMTTDAFAVYDDFEFCLPLTGSRS